MADTSKASSKMEWTEEHDDGKDNMVLFSVEQGKSESWFNLGHYRCKCKQNRRCSVQLEGQTKGRKSMESSKNQC